jgi:adenylate kinase family enzyme
MVESLIQRTVIIGNSGAGKSVLADGLAALIDAPVVDLDLLHWERDRYGRKRDEEVARQMTVEVSARPIWIIEGVYGWLAELALPRATALIWLDFPWSLCRAGLLARSPRRGATDQDSEDLLTWAEAYWSRRTPSSFSGHSQMFNDFSGAKFRLENRDQVARFVTDLHTDTVGLKTKREGI